MIHKVTFIRSTSIWKKLGASLSAYRLLFILGCILVGLILFNPSIQRLGATSPQETSNLKKRFSGIHLGNKVRDLGSDWTEKELSLIDPDQNSSNQEGVVQWPAMVVVMSNQVYRAGLA